MTIKLPLRPPHPIPLPRGGEGAQGERPEFIFRRGGDPAAQTGAGSGRRRGSLTLRHSFMIIN